MRAALAGVVHEDDGASVAEARRDARHHAVRVGAGDAVVRADGPADSEEIEVLRDAGDDGVGVADGGAEQRRRLAGDSFEDFHPSLQVLADAALRAQGEEAVVGVGVEADTVAAGEDLANELGVLLRLSRDDEERGLRGRRRRAPRGRAGVLFAGSGPSSKVSAQPRIPRGAFGERVSEHVRRREREDAAQDDRDVSHDEGGHRDEARRVADDRLPRHEERAERHGIEERARGGHQGLTRTLLRRRGGRLVLRLVGPFRHAHVRRYPGLLLVGSLRVPACCRARRDRRAEDGADER